MAYSQLLVQPIITYNIITLTFIREFKFVESENIAKNLSVVKKNQKARTSDGQKLLRLEKSLERN